MAEEEIIRFKRAYIQQKIDIMRNNINEYKRSVDKCNPAEISSVSMSIAKLGDILTANKEFQSNEQKNEIDILDGEFAKQFQRLSKDKICECKRKDKK